MCVILQAWANPRVSGRVPCQRECKNRITIEVLIRADVTDEERAEANATGLDVLAMAAKDDQGEEVGVNEPDEEESDDGASQVQTQSTPISCC